MMVLLSGFFDRMWVIWFQVYLYITLITSFHWGLGLLHSMWVAWFQVIPQYVWWYFCWSSHWFDRMWVAWSQVHLNCLIITHTHNLTGCELFDLKCASEIPLTTILVDDHTHLIGCKWCQIYIQCPADDPTCFIGCELLSFKCTLEVLITMFCWKFYMLRRQWVTPTHFKFAPETFSIISMLSFILQNVSYLILCVYATINSDNPMLVIGLT